MATWPVRMSNLPDEMYAGRQEKLKDNFKQFRLPIEALPPPPPTKIIGCGAVGGLTTGVRGGRKYTRVEKV